MQTQDKPAGQKTKPASPPASSPRRRRLVPALAGAAAVIVALVIGVVALSSGQKRVSQYADAAAAGEPDAIFGLFVESYRTGDVAGALPYVDADLSVLFTNLSDATTWMPGLIEFQGALYGRDEPGPSVCEGPDESGWVSCTFTEPADGILAAAGFPETTYRGKLADGRIVTYQFPGRAEGDVTISGITDSVEIPLGEYAAGIDPEGMAAQCDVARGLQAGELTSGFPLVKNQQCGAFIAGFLDDYLATLGG
ncbi:MAG: hypothetical protein KJO97_05040 [Acidimicrobiia bacterium]|nr:hypothetical protein [Acidimicrobiia bacterium]